MNAVDVAEAPSQTVAKDAPAKGRLRHIAITVPDPWKAAKFYMEAFGMEKVAETDSPLAKGVYLTDGVINLAILNYKTDETAGVKDGKHFYGVHHMGFWVDDCEVTRNQIEKAGGKWWMGEVGGENTFYEVKFRDPDNIIVDISANGWGGAQKDGVPRPRGPKARD
jgi:predicted enzyme related to lactoylglutathione lyase